MPTWGWIVRVTALCSLVLFEDRQSETLWLLPVIPGEFDLYLQRGAKFVHWSITHWKCGGKRKGGNGSRGM